MRAPAPVISQGEHQQGVNALSVQGKGEVYAAPDMATLSISLSKTAPTTKEAQKPKIFRRRILRSGRSMIMGLEGEKGR